MVERLEKIQRISESREYDPLYKLIQAGYDLSQMMQPSIPEAEEALTSHFLQVESGVCEFSECAPLSI